MGPTDITNQQVLAAIVDLDTRLTARIDTLEVKLTALDSRMATLESKVTTIESKMATMESKMVNLESEMANLESKVATKEDLKQLEVRLTRKLDSHKAISVRHHLETRRLIGNVQVQHLKLREGLAQAAGAAI